MTSEVGSGQVAIFPTFKGFRKAVGDETDASATASATGFKKIFAASAETTGKTTGAGFARAFDSSTGSLGAAATKKLQSEVAAAARSLSTARLKEQDSAGKVRVAEAQLTEARSQNVAGSAKVVAAEEKLASAQRASTSAQETAVAATTRLKTAQDTLVSSSRSSGGLFSSLSRGAGGLASSLRSALTPLLSIAAGLIGLQLIEGGFRKLVGFVQGSLSIMAQWQVINAQSVAFVKSTGRAAHISAGQVHELSLAIEESTGTEAQQVQQGANIIGTFKNIRNQAGKNNKIFDQTTLAAVNMARAMGLQVPAAALQLGKALNDPAKGLSKLTRQGVTFTQQQKDEIDALEKAGNLLGAQKIILQEVNSEFGASGTEFRETLPGAATVMKGAFDQLRVKLTSGLSPAFVRVIDLVTTTINKLKDSSFVNGLITRLTSYVDVLESKFSRVITLVENLSGTANGVTFGGVTSGLSKILPKLAPLLNLVAVIGPMLGLVLKNAGPDLAKTLLQLAPPLSKLIIALLPLLPPLTALALVLIPVLIDGIKVLIPVISFFATNLKNTFGVIGAAVDFFSGKLSPKRFLDKITAIEGGFFTIPASVNKALSSAAVSINNFIAVGLRNLVSGTNAAIGKAVEFFVGLQARILHAVAGAGTWLVQAGKNIVEGLINGIRSHLKDLGSFLGTIGNFIVQHKGPPAADAVLLVDNGRRIMNGLIDGIKDRQGNLSKILADVQSGLVARTTVAASGSSGAASAAIYVQNPWTGEYLLAKAASVAQNVVTAHDNGTAAGVNGGLNR